MLFAFSVAPTGGGSADGSVHDAVAEAVSIVRSSGLPHQTGSMFTTIEGDWDECMDVIKRATEAVTKRAPRVSLVVKADIRPGHDHGEIEGKVQRLNAAIDQMESGNKLGILARQGYMLMRHIELTAIVAMLYACVTGGAYSPCEGTSSR